MSNFRPGYLQQGAPLGAVRKQVMLNADNIQVDPSGAAYLELMSNDTTAANRTFTLVANPKVGYQLQIVFASGSSNTCQLADSGTVKLSAAWEPTQYDSLTLMSDGTYWIEMGRGQATGLPDIPLTSAHILVGSSGGLATDVAMSGIVAISNTGATSIPLTSAQVLVGNGCNVAAAVAVSGDITVTNAGVTAIGASKVLTTMIADANVTLAKLASGITPSHVVKFAGKHTSTGGAASEAFTVTGVASTDVLMVTIQTVGITPRTIVSAAPTLNTITIVFSGDPSTDHIVAYEVLRAAT